MDGMLTLLTIYVWKHVLTLILVIIPHGNVFWNALFLSYLLVKVSIELVLTCVLRELMLTLIAKNVLSIALVHSMTLMPINPTIHVFNNVHTPSMVIQSHINALWSVLTHIMRMWLIIDATNAQMNAQSVLTLKIVSLVLQIIIYIQEDAYRVALLSQ